MPQMGESIAEGTIVRWIKKVGDAVDRDEPLFEISTDKVDAEIPSPAAGVLAEIKVKEGETVAVNSVVGDDWRGRARRAPPAGDLPGRCVPPPRRPWRAAAAARRLAVAAERARSNRRAGSPPPSGQQVRSQRPHPAMERSANGEGVLSKDEQRRAKSSPLVRKIAREHRSTSAVSRARASAGG